MPGIVDLLRAAVDKLSAQRPKQPTKPPPMALTVQESLTPVTGVGGPKGLPVQNEVQHPLVPAMEKANQVGDRWGQSLAPKVPPRIKAAGQNAIQAYANWVNQRAANTKPGAGAKLRKGMDVATERLEKFAQGASPAYKNTALDRQILQAQQQLGRVKDEGEL